MADEVDPIATQLAAIASAHVTRMTEIGNESLQNLKDASEEMVASIKKRAGVKSALLDAQLTALGIIPTPEEIE